MNDDNTLVEKLSNNRGKYRKAVFDRNISNKAQLNQRSSAGREENISIASLSSVLGSTSSDDTSDMDEFYEVSTSSDMNFLPPGVYQQNITSQAPQYSSNQPTSQRFGLSESKASAVVATRESAIHPQTQDLNKQNLQTIQRAILSGKVRVKANSVSPSLVMQPRLELTPAQIAQMECNRKIALALRESKKR